MQRIAKARSPEQHHPEPREARPWGSVGGRLIRTAILALAAIPIATDVAGAAGGALVELELEPKGLAAAPVLQLEAACTLDAEALDRSCSGTYVCGPSTEVACREVKGGLDHVAAGTGLRDSGHGTIELRGAPQEATAVAAWLFWGVITTDPADPAAAKVVFDEKEVLGEKLGISREPCWSHGADFVAYRASVPDRLRPSINGDYRLRVPISAGTAGGDPWGPKAAGPPYVDGASLLVVYAHFKIPRGARFFLHQGPRRLIGELELRHALTPPVVAGSSLRHTRIGADGQRRAGARPVAPFRTSWSVDGFDWLAIRGPGSSIDPHPDWQGADGGPIDQLWDTQITELKLTAQGEALWLDTYFLRYETVMPGPGYLFDCVAVAAHALSVR